MIQIAKGISPRALTNAKARYDAINNPAYLADESGYNTGRRKFSFTDAYKHDDVKDALERDQHGKCCFSEAKFVNDDAHVEHFRPKGFVEEYPNGKKTYPGYYWLAYDWSNLMYCKSTTNSSKKRNFFPLMGRTTRNRNHMGTKVEIPVLINPCIENPRDHIRFRNEEIRGVTRRGKKNIKLLDLRNGQLDEARRTTFKKLLLMKDAVDLMLSVGIPVATQQVASIITELKRSVRPEAEFSSMAIDLLTGWPHLV